MHKVYEFRRNGWGLAFTRISQALHKFAPPSIKWTTFEDCEISLVHVVGAAEEDIVRRSIECRKKLVIFQHCYLTARMDWESYFKECHLVVSYQDLTQYSAVRYRFVRTPWGFDPDEFHVVPASKVHRVYTTGHIADTECIDKTWEACKLADVTLHHTGQDFGWTSHYQFHPYMRSAAEFCQFVNQAQYVTCLRVIEGFEMLGVEALACGVRPIVPALDCYDWYEGHAYRVDMNDSLIRQLAAIVSAPPTPISDEEQQEIKRKFAWKGIVRDLFTHMLRA